MHDHNKLFHTVVFSSFSFSNYPYCLECPVVLVRLGMHKGSQFSFYLPLIGRNRNPRMHELQLLYPWYHINLAAFIEWPLKRLGCPLIKLLLVVFLLLLKYKIAQTKVAKKRIFTKMPEQPHNYLYHTRNRKTTQGCNKGTKFCIAIQWSTNC